MSAADFLNLLFEPDDLIELRPIRHDGGGAAGRDWIDRDTLASMNGKLDRLNVNASIYFGVNPRNGRGGERDHVALCRCLFADFDDGATPEEVRAKIAESGLPRPSATVNSGGGVHVYWRLADPISPDEFASQQVRLIEVLGSDEKIKDPPRIMRLPGTINRKPERNNAKCSVVEITGEVFDLEDIVMRLPEEAAPLSQSDSEPVTPRTYTTATDAEARAVAYVQSMPEAKSGENGHKKLMAAVRCVYDGFSLDRATAKSVIVNHYSPTCSPPWSDREIEHKLDEVEKVAGKRPAAGCSISPSTTGPSQRRGSGRQRRP